MVLGRVLCSFLLVLSFGFHNDPFRAGPHLRAGGGSQFQNDPGFGGVGVGQFSPLNTLSWGWGGVLSPPLSPQQLGGKMFAGDP